MENIRNLLNGISWGTVSDWCMVIITSITAYYLYKTLQSQKQVQHTQTKLFEIESIRFRESIKPILRYSLSQIKFSNDNKDEQLTTIEVINETESIALDINCVPADNTTQVFIALDYPRKNHKRGDKPLLFHFLLDFKVNAPKFIGFCMNYQDVAGTKYKQDVFCILYGKEEEMEINPFLPEIIG